MSASDTIFAVASGAGRAAIAVVRISGTRARAAVAAICGRVPPPRLATLATLRSPETGGVLDQALVLWFPAPASFTGEDCAEFHVHGGRAVVAGVLEALAAVPGCRMATAGEFARRAFLNGKMDLSAAEGLGDLIEAETRAQKEQALRQLDGPLGKRAEAWRSAIVRAAAMVEAELDFTDEADVPETSVSSAQALLRPVREEIAALLAGERRAAERLREGYTVVIAGPPNAGKSTLLNALARRDVAIVSAHAGTTRDLLDVHLDLDGLPVSLVDTAGIRDSADPVEQEGIARARRRAGSADLVLWLQAVDDPEPGALPLGERHTLRVATKVDRGEAPTGCDLAISATTGTGMDALVAEISRLAGGAFVGAETALVTRARHRELLAAATSALERACAAPGSTPLELLAEDIRLAARSLGGIAGSVGVEDVLDEVFARFCIGK